MVSEVHGRVVLVAEVTCGAGRIGSRKMSLLYALDILMMSCRFCS